jgi:hypothetical protein
MVEFIQVELVDHMVVELVELTITLVALVLQAQ